MIILLLLLLLFIAAVVTLLILRIVCACVCVHCVYHFTLPDRVLHSWKAIAETRPFLLYSRSISIHFLCSALHSNGDHKYKVDMDDWWLPLDVRTCISRFSYSLPMKTIRCACTRCVMCQITHINYRAVTVERKKNGRNE